MQTTDKTTTTVSAPDNAQFSGAINRHTGKLDTYYKHIYPKGDGVWIGYGQLTKAGTPSKKVRGVSIRRYLPRNSSTRPNLVEFNAERETKAQPIRDRIALLEAQIEETKNELEAVYYGPVETVNVSTYSWQDDDPEKVFRASADHVHQEGEYGNLRTYGATRE